MISAQIVPYQRIQFFGTKQRIDVEVSFNAFNDPKKRLFLDTDDLSGFPPKGIEIPVCDQYTIQEVLQYFQVLLRFKVMYMGLNAHVVFDTTCPNIGPGDLLLVNCACTTIGYTVMGFAKRLGAKVAAITANPRSKAAALFEQAIFIYEDIVAQLLMKKLSITAEQMAKRHTNLDGYMDFNIDG